MCLIVGLGNPGPQYSETRHNAGFMALDHLAARHNFVFAASKWQADFAKGSLWQKQLFLLKPLTFMNLSGQAVVSCAGFYKLSPAKIIVIHDDLDLPVGRIKIVARGGSGGHNGIRSIMAGIGGADFARIKIGIGRPDLPVPTERYVLSKFSEEERVLLNERLPLVEEGIRLFVTEGINQAMNQVNSKGL